MVRKLFNAYTGKSEWFEVDMKVVVELLVGLVHLQGNEPCRQKEQ